MIPALRGLTENGQRFIADSYNIGNAANRPGGEIPCPLNSFSPVDVWTACWTHPTVLTSGGKARLTSDWPTPCSAATERTNFKTARGGEDDAGWLVLARSPIAILTAAAAVCSPLQVRATRTWKTN